MIKPDMDCSDNAFKQLPYYKAIAKSLIRKQIQYLLEELSDQTGDESIILTANVNSGTLSHQGSSTAKGFLDNRDDIKTEFLSYIISSNIERAQKEYLKETKPPKPKKPVSDGPMHGQAQLMPTMLPREPMMPRDSTLGTPMDEELGVTGLSEGSAEKNGGSVSGQDGEKESEQGTSEQFSGQGSPDDSNSNFNADGKEVLVKVEPKPIEAETEFEGGGPGVEYSGGSMYLSHPWAQENSGFGPTSSAMSMMINRTPPTVSPAVPLSKPPTIADQKESISCPFCGRMVAKSTLRSHMLTHQGVKKFECDFCNRKFTHKTTLTNHRRLHTGEKPHRCEICGSGFPALSGLAQHKQSKHPMLVSGSESP